MFERYRAAMHRASSVFCEWCRTSWKGLWEAAPNKEKRTEINGEKFKTA